ncbi:glycoside hydrolase family 3 C-terminal domain-containing protein [Labilibaculum sp. DW002]|uniref:Glycoside hydrolase family 3 C-terminal domain-containing protein n=1 Tax=Paralabilibaculum antarcticum TaxID=2912572 RepID=A0ABT5VPN1_9BACT|nr:glycoside hydrolase family 3 C-terminal domain-containing protein [Labilibaculum sp. DW002]MDE5417378.1 glycoside hydrolase family 3 C-terminal domain-containing protein [Labilibaculum sp. DW002]
MKLGRFIFLILVLLPNIGFSQSEYRFNDCSLSIEERVDDLMSRLTVEEKVFLLQASGKEISRLGVDKYYHGNEGLHGVVKGGRFTVFPQAIALSATWNPDLIYNVATAISDEARAKWNFLNQGKDQTSGYSDMLTMWSPTINMARDPRWGRTPETYGEDPFLTSKIGLSFVNGLQGDDEKYLKVVATPKHFVANNEEENRFACNADISERALREYYLPAFKACIVEGKAQAIMSAYNAINGIPCTANNWLLQTVLRDEWGFTGYVVSDCGAPKYLEKSHHYVETPQMAAKVAIEAGLDLECGNVIYTNHLYPAYQAGLVKKESIDKAARRVLEARFKLGIFDPAAGNPYAKISPDVIGSKEHQELALETSRQSIVLLKNQDNILPLDANAIKKVAVVGFNANQVVFGDYSGLPVISPISPLKGIQNKLADKAEVQYVKWKTAARNLNILESEYLRNDKNDGKGLYAEYYDDKFLEGTPQTRTDKVVNFDPVNQPPDPYTNYKHKSIRWTGYIAPNITGDYKIGVNSDDGIRLWLNDELVVDEWHNRGTTTDQVDIKMEAGKKYAIKLEYFDNGGDAICQLLWKVPNADGGDLYEEDRLAARSSDYVIAVMGINKTIEKEGKDRVELGLPEDQVNYLKDIYKENKNMIVVLVAGSSLAINWMDATVPAIVDAWYPGESGGTAIADVLFGDYNPAGRLPFTFYKSEKDLPPMNDYEVTKGRTYQYFEGEALYSFGYGLSYTSFAYSDMKIAKNQESITISATVKNTGDYEGDEVVQLYVKDVKSSVQRPLKQLVGFKRTSLAIGESKSISFEVPIQQLMFWDEKCNEWHFEKGAFEFMIGASSSDIRLKKTCKVK